MAQQLTDILDLEFLLGLDNEVADKTILEKRLHRDRQIYQSIEKKDQTEQALVWEWYDIRKDQFLNESGDSESAVLPGETYALLYRWMKILVMVVGSVVGFILAGSFLAYHGSRPINVTVFSTLFVLIPFVFCLLALVAIGMRMMDRESSGQGSIWYIMPSMIRGICFHWLYDFLNTLKRRSPLPAKGNDGLDRFNQLEFRHLFFWPFFLLSSMLAAFFSLGGLGALFFKVLVSDMAFGWQSTLITSSQTVYQIVSAMAAPWSWILSSEIATPSLEQIQGSRIILKEGISVLATPDLISWWPFLCMSLITYGLIPRFILAGFGAWIQQQEVETFEFRKPEIRQLVARMTSPLVEIKKEPIHTDSVASNKEQTEPITSDFRPEPKPEQKEGIPGKKALILASDRVYDPHLIAEAAAHITSLYGVPVGSNHPFVLNAADPAGCMDGLDMADVDPVIVLYEAWQPPIRGLLHSVILLKKALPQAVSLWIVLTNDAGHGDLGLAPDDPQADVWDRAIESLSDPMIRVKRMIRQ